MRITTWNIIPVSWHFTQSHNVTIASANIDYLSHAPLQEIIASLYSCVARSTLDWFNREDNAQAADGVPYRLLEAVDDLPVGDQR